ncbi:MAG: hypothetical protein R3F61_31150 [Myxococcota bacterium]
MAEFEESTATPAPIAGALLIGAGVVHLCTALMHGGFVMLGLGMVAVDPEIHRDPDALPLVTGVLLCFLVPDVVSSAVGALQGVFGLRARQIGPSSLSLAVALLGVLWPMCRVVMDVLTCQCTTFVLYLPPMLVSLGAVVFITRRE